MIDDDNDDCDDGGKNEEVKPSQRGKGEEKNQVSHTSVAFFPHLPLHLVRSLHH